ncbi:uncharacterized protein C1orf105 homolog [Rhinolophus sinicus]|uniref:uncharacterized protein C1orf105 homolog n=1 Tax=Rhinolophus sinicus TaxID=89399 RepID=UPI003D7AEF7E
METERAGPAYRELRPAGAYGREPRMWVGPARAQEGRGQGSACGHRINPPNNLVRQLGESGTVTCRGAEQKHLGLAAAAEPARRKLSRPSVSLNFLSRQVPPATERPLIAGLLWFSQPRATASAAGPRAEPERPVLGRLRRSQVHYSCWERRTQAGRNQSNLLLVRNKQLCSTCREMKMIQPRTMMIPGDEKLSFKNFMSHRMMSLQPPKAQTAPKGPRDDIPTESVHYRLPILGPRTAVFHRLLSDTYRTLQETQLSSSPRKEPAGKTGRQ